MHRVKNSHVTSSFQPVRPWASGSGVGAVAWREQAGGLLVAVRAQPRARRNAVEGVAADAAGVVRLRVAVTAPPEDGKATAAACAALAGAVGVAPSRVRVLSGAEAREKLLLVEGDGAVLAARLELVVAEQSSRTRSKI